MEGRSSPGSGRSVAEPQDGDGTIAERQDGDGTVAERQDGDGTDAGIHVGVLVAHSPGGAVGMLQPFAERMVRDAVGELAAITDVTWEAHPPVPDPLTDRSSRRASEFLDEAALHMVNGEYDLVVVVTDVPLASRVEKHVEGLASPLSRVVVVSTRRLRWVPGRESVRSLDSEPVRWNAATLLLHLLGHVLGAGHGDGEVMRPFSFDPDRRSVPSFDADVRADLRRLATRVPQADVPRGPIRRVAFHALTLARNPRTVASTLANSRAPLIPLSLPRLSTAAVTPTLILVFSAEAWDVGLNLTNLTASLFAAGSIVAAAVHLLFVQRLFFPRERSHGLTEHMALVNVTVFFILVLAMCGLFALVGSIMILIELAIFPPNLMNNWPTLEDPAVGFVDLVRIGGFISTLGLLSGALAGGIENRMSLRHLALFLDRP